MLGGGDLAVPVAGDGGGGHFGTLGHGLNHAIPVEFAVPAVHLGDFGRQLAAVTLGKTAHYVYSVDVAVGLLTAGIQDGFDGFFLGIADKAAGVDNHCTMAEAVGIVHGVDAQVAEATQYTLAVHKVLRAPHGD